MMLLNKIIKYTGLFLVFSAIVIAVIGPAEIALGYLYLTNRKSITIDDFRVKMLFLHWAYTGENKIAHVVAGKNFGSNSLLIAEFFKNAEKLKLCNMNSTCDNLKQKTYQGSGVTGEIYLCTKNKKEIIYFQSNDKKILIRVDDYNSSNSEMVKEYTILLENIEKIPA